MTTNIEGNINNERTTDIRRKCIRLKRIATTLGRPPISETVKSLPFLGIVATTRLKCVSKGALASVIKCLWAIGISTGLVVADSGSRTTT